MKGQAELPLPMPSKWTKPKGKYHCRRDPEAGPGTCWYWWEGCPEGAKRGCYLLWLKEQQSPDKGAEK